MVTHPVVIRWSQAPLRLAKGPFRRARLVRMGRVRLLWLALAAGSCSGSPTGAAGNNVAEPVLRPDAGRAALAKPAAAARQTETPNRPDGPQLRRANPQNYLDVLATLQPGDTLFLQAGDYLRPDRPAGLPLRGVNGQPGAPITITGPASGKRARLLGRGTTNTIRLANSSYLIIRNLVVNGRNRGGAAVKAEGPTHHITVENLLIYGVGAHQQVVGISTAGGPAWHWTIRSNTIVGAGTGIYLGDSNGGHPFIAGLVEGNLVRDTIGYNMQIKHQNLWQMLPGMPLTPSRTIIRHNVFAKSANSSDGSLARPNLLVGHQPLSGPGAEDRFEIYGNFFYQNPSEFLFQGEGNLAFYSNVLINNSNGAVTVHPHNATPRNVYIFGNTVVAASVGIEVNGVPQGNRQIVAGNAVFAGAQSTAESDRYNMVAHYTDAASHLNVTSERAGSRRGQLDLRPADDHLKGAAPDTAAFKQFTDWDKDFNGVRRDWRYRGAYGSAGANPGRPLSLQPMPLARE